VIQTWHAPPTAMPKRPATGSPPTFKVTTEANGLSATTFISLRVHSGRRKSWESGLVQLVPLPADTCSPGPRAPIPRTPTDRFGFELHQLARVPQHFLEMNIVGLSSGFERPLAAYPPARLALERAALEDAVGIDQASRSERISGPRDE